MTKNILVVDDDALVLSSMGILLKKQGYNVTTASSGKEALEKVEKEDFDLIIIDIRMPELDGVETIQSIYEDLEKRNLKKIPTIFITGYADAEIQRKAKTLQPIAYIYKPFDNSELVDKIREVTR
jgi:CheY-like chemotaxis protein